MAGVMLGFAGKLSGERVRAEGKEDLSDDVHVRVLEGAADEVAREEGRVAAQVRKYVVEDAVVDDAEAPAQYQVIIKPARTPREAQARSEVITVGLKEPGRQLRPSRQLVPDPAGQR